jgi:hypothetical protein
MNSGLREAPPTKNPSISGFLASSLELEPVTEPPYIIRVDCDTASLTFEANHCLNAACTSCACSGEAIK